MTNVSRCFYSASFIISTAHTNSNFLTLRTNVFLTGSFLCFPLALYPVTQFSWSSVAVLDAAQSTECVFFSLSYPQQSFQESGKAENGISLKSYRHIYTYCPQCNRHALRVCFLHKSHFSFYASSLLRTGDPNCCWTCNLSKHLIMFTHIMQFQKVFISFLSTENKSPTSSLKAVLV